MLEAGWLLLFLFLGVCSLIVVALMWPSFRRARQGHHQIVDEVHAFTSRAPRQAPVTPLATVLTLPEKTERRAAQSLKPRTLTMPEWLEMVNDRPDDAPHTLIIGTSGSGKTTLAQAIAASRPGYLVILDPKWTPGKWGGLPAIPIDDNGRYTQIEAAIKALLAELNGRLVALKQGTTTFAELTIIAEELPTLISECPSAPSLFKQIGRLGRELSIRLLGLSQSERVKSLGIAGEGDALGNYTFIRLGNTAIGLMEEARNRERPAVLEWRGEYYLMEIDAVPRLATRPIHSLRSWALARGESSQSEQSQTQSDDHEPIALTFSPEEVGKIALLIVRGAERKQAIRAMPRYSRKQHKEFAAFYDQLKEIMTTAAEDR